MNEDDLISQWYEVQLFLGIALYCERNFKNSLIIELVQLARKFS